MAISSLGLAPRSAIVPDGTTNNAAPQYSLRKGSETAPAKHIVTADFDASTAEHLWWAYTMPQNYSSGPIVRIQWMANATTGSVVWGAQIGAVTPADADTPIEHVLATATTATTATNTTEARRLNETTITLANLDSLAAGDLFLLHVYRDAANGSDTCTVDAEVIAFSLDYTTT
jgi:hypothetical protein